MAISRVCAVLVVACALAPGLVDAQDVTLRDAIDCAQFKRDASGNWHAKDVSLNYGPSKKNQLNLFGNSTITQKSHPDLFAALNAKCAAGR